MNRLNKGEKTMKLDSIALSAVTHEIKKKWIPSKIIDLYQLSRYELLLVLKNNNITGKLFFSIRPDRMAIFLSDSSLPSENFASLFFNQLKNWIQGGTLLRVEHVQFDRILKITIEPYIKFGPKKRYQLIIELMGKHSNIILIDETDMIKATLKQVGSEVNRYREIKASISYMPPPQQDKLNPLKVSHQEFSTRLKQTINTPQAEFLWQFIQWHFTGFGLKSAKEIVGAMDFPIEMKLSQISEEKWTDLWKAFTGVMQRIKKNNFSPKVLLDKDSHRVIDYFLLCPFHNPDTVAIPFQNISSCLEFVFNRLSEEAQKENYYHTIEKALKNHWEKLEKREQFLEVRKKEIANCEEYKKKGELIKANCWNIKPGIREITVFDYTDTCQNPIIVSLNPELTPLENARHYFKKYKKLQFNRDNIEKQIKENEKFRHELKTMMKKFSESKDSLEELSLLYQQLMKWNYIQKDKKVPSRRKTEQAPAINKFLSPDGWTILVGKNNKQNEYMLRHLTSGNDFWLHHQTRPGSHVIIKNHKNLEVPPYSTLLFAARLAGFYSKTKDKEQALIVYTLRKYVRKPRNTRMGKVIYSNEKTIPVTMNHQEIKKDIHRMQIR